jgi:hypothetical protein
MEERLKFVARLLEGEKMTVVCREFGISRKTGYKIFNRYKELGIDALNDQSRRPLRYANQLPFQLERRILAIKKERPTWGAPKIREKLIREYPQIRPPAKSNVWCKREVPRKELDTFLNQHRLDVPNSTARIKLLRTKRNAVHDASASENSEWVF